MSVLQRIFQDHGRAYLETYGDRVPVPHRRVLYAVCTCRTAATRTLMYRCAECGERHFAASSCGNRHCPVCQGRKALEWVHGQMEKLLPCTYFFATFTLPSELRTTARSHQAEVYGAMMKSAADSLKTLEADPRFAGCRVAGFTAVMHTWGRKLQYHPHVHVIIPGGGLSADRSRWIAASDTFLVHVRALSAAFRGRMQTALQRAGLSAEVPPAVWRRDWVVDCRAAGDGRAVLRYLGAYVCRVAVSDSRIADYDGHTVTVRYRKVGSSRWRHVSFTPFEFIRRFLQHVLPSGFTKVRHYGFLSPNFSVPIQRIRELISILCELLRDMLEVILPPLPPRSAPRCPVCGTPMIFVSASTIRLRGGASP